MVKYFGAQNKNLSGFEVSQINLNFENRSIFGDIRTLVIICLRVLNGDLRGRAPFAKNFTILALICVEAEFFLDFIGGTKGTFWHP